MNAQRVVQNCVLKNQSTVIEEMIRANPVSYTHLNKQRFIELGKRII